MLFKEGDLVRSVSEHGIIRVVVIPNKHLNCESHESIGVAECDVYAGRAVNIRQVFVWTLPAYWELLTEDAIINRIIEEEVKRWK
jgi:hypothetical protein